MDYTENYISHINNGLKQSICKSKGVEENLNTFLNSMVSLTELCQNSNGRIFFVGNGASAAFCNHMALDWSKNGGINSVSLSDSAFLTALANDYSYESAFSEFLKINDCNEKDLVVTVSSSGNSSNIVSVLNFCKENNIPSIGFSGLKPENISTQLAKYSLYVPVKTYGMAECIHQVFLHMWLDKFMEIYEWDRDEVQNMNIKDFKL
ncbi:SIS domain-containing protein [Ekhidna sp.]|uniref:SIS domain-containing protein n=1 Tax=Ekhidna sp. TaxID=2608089 RepID=UPI003B50E3F5